MKKIAAMFLLINILTFSNDRIKLDVFVGQDIYGIMKVDRTDIKKDYDEFNLNLKVNLGYKVYKSMYFETGVSYETYFMPEYNESYNLIPLFFGVRYIDENKTNIHPYVGLMYGENILLNEEKFPINTEKNGFAEASLGILYKKKYFAEVAYKHHAFAYKPVWPSNNYWNGKIISLNIGYRLK